MEDTIAHVCLNVANADEAVEWYTENFDLEDALSWSGETDQGHTVNRYVSDGNGTMIQFREAEKATEFGHGPGYDHLGIRVGDLDGAFERVDHAGVVREPQDNPSSNARFAFIKDPFGNVIELFSPFESSQLS
jgi:lactoylglutathione lyase